MHVNPSSRSVALGYTSPAEAQIAATQIFDSKSLSVFEALVNVGAMVGAAASGWLSDTLGRKVPFRAPPRALPLLQLEGGIKIADLQQRNCPAAKWASWHSVRLAPPPAQGAISAACYPFIAGWVAIMYGGTATVLLLGRFLTGVGVGVVSNAVPVFIAEVAPPKLRGTLGSTNQLAVTFGILIVYLIGLESLGFTWRELAAVALCPLAILLLATFFIPGARSGDRACLLFTCLRRCQAYSAVCEEHIDRCQILIVPPLRLGFAESPRWLCAANKKEEAAAALRVLRGTENIHAELHDLHAAALEAASLPAATPADFFQRRAVAGPLAVSLSLMAFQQFSGINAVIFNSTGIFASAGVQSAGIAALCVAVLQVLVTAVSVVLMDLAGRRPLLLTAAIGMGASCVALGIALKGQHGIVAVRRENPQRRQRCNLDHTRVAAA